jgi:drug/metabolite transporter (DMT)-like permease
MKATGSSKYTIYLVALLSMLFWGLSFVWSTIVFRYYSPIATIFLRLALSVSFLFIFLKSSGTLQRIRKQDLSLLMLSALFNPFFYFLGENFGLKYSTPAIAAVIIATIPIFTPLAAWYSLKERLPLINIIGIFISFTGIAVMLINPDFTLSAPLKGVSLLMFAVASAVVYSIFLKKLTEKYSPVNIIAYQNLIGVILFLPLFLVFDLGNVLATPLTAELVTSLLLLAIFASSLAFIFFTMTVRSIGVSRANVFSNLIPVFTAVFSYIFISEIFTYNKIAGMLIVIFGVGITQIRKSTHIKKAK